MSLLAFNRHRVELDQSHKVEESNDGVDRVNLKPFFCKISFATVSMVVVVVSFAQHKRIERHEVFRGVTHFVIGVANLVCKPVHYGSVYGPHQDVYWDE